MSLDLSDPALAALRARLAPYAAGLLDASGDYAAAQHADEVGPEHLLATLMAAEESAAYRTVLFAFADPDTIAAEARAMSAGILVTGSRATLPFSALGVVALREAREHAHGDGGATVRPAHLLWSAIAALPEDLREQVVDAGFAIDGLGQLPRPAASDAPVPLDGPLFRHFDEDATQSLLQAARLAQGEDLASIGPASLALASLRSQPALEGPAGVTATRLRIVLRGREADESPPAVAELGPDDALVEYLEGLAPASTTAALLARFHAGGFAELAELLARHKVTPALLERTASAFEDPSASD